MATAAAPPDRLDLFLFLQELYLGGVWEATKDLLSGLVEVNRERRRFSLTIGIHEEHPEIHTLEEFGDDLRVVRVRPKPITRAQAVRLLGEVPTWLAARPEQQFFLPGGDEVALRADAWFALLDRFPLPLLPARPYAVMVFDMIQRHVPEAFSPIFFEWTRVGMRPTMALADLVFVTSPVTAGDVVDGYGVDVGRIRQVPVAWDAGRRFGGVEPEPVPGLREPFILNVTNVTAHKGARLMLEAHARLRERMGPSTPALVLCGVNTHTLSSRYEEKVDHRLWVFIRALATKLGREDTLDRPYWAYVRNPITKLGLLDKLDRPPLATILKLTSRAGLLAQPDPPYAASLRKLVAELGLTEGHDVFFLGYVSDARLVDLYRRCSVVANAAKYDNGSFNTVEAAYFGRPAVSSRYPAAEYVHRRFGVPVRFFPVDDAAAMAQALFEALAAGPVTGPPLERMRSRLADPELGTRRYAERFYDALLDLAERGRRVTDDRNNRRDRSSGRDE